ncbi:MAG: DedA family protein [Turicibacter sp.]
MYIVSLTMIGALLGNLSDYFISYKFGSAIYDDFYKKLPATQNSLGYTLKLSHKYGPIACLMGRSFPATRTCVSLVSGICKIKLKNFLLYSLHGISMWNLILVSIGYFITSFCEIINN